MGGSCPGAGCPAGGRLVRMCRACCGMSSPPPQLERFSLSLFISIPIKPFPHLEGNERVATESGHVCTAHEQPRLAGDDEKVAVHLRACIACSIDLYLE